MNPFLGTKWRRYYAQIEVETNRVTLRLLDGNQSSFDDVESAVNYLRQACRAPDVIDQVHSIQASIQALKIK